MSAKNKKAKISVKKLIKFAGIMIVFVYAAFILVKQQLTLSQLEAIREKKQESIAAAELEIRRCRTNTAKPPLTNILSRQFVKILAL